MRRKPQIVDRHGRYLRDYVEGESILADGEVLRVGMLAFDSAGAPARTVDALPAHKPGFRVADAAAADYAHGAYLARRRTLADSWRAA
jgi:hypothetical protein